MKLFRIDFIMKVSESRKISGEALKNISNDIKNQNYKRVYLVYGEEKYLVRKVKQEMIRHLAAEGDTMNFTRFSGKDISSKELMNICDTMPFFADRRLVLVEDSGFFKNADDEIASYLKEIPETTVLLFIESEVDKRNKVYKQAKSIGYVCECARMNQSDLSKRVLMLLTKEHKKITRENMTYLLEKLGNDMDNIASEVEKLISYTLGRDVIEREDIDQVCVSEITGKIFEMIDAIGSRNQKKALNLYYDLIAVREAPLRILYLLARQFNLMLQIKEMEQKGYAAPEIAKNMGVQPFIVNKTRGQCKNFKLSAIRSALNDCLKMEEAVKTGNMNDKMAVELLIVRYSVK